MGWPYMLAAVSLATLGAAAGIYISWRSGWNEMSDSMVASRTALFSMSLSGAVWLAGVALANDSLGRGIFGFAALAVFGIQLAYQWAFVASKRRQLVVAWREGRELPRGVTEASVQAWASTHPDV